MLNLIWYLLSFVFLLISRVVQYNKSKGLLFALILCIIDFNVILNPILMYIGNKYFYSSFIGILYFLIILAYIPIKYLVFKKKNIAYSSTEIFIDIAVIFGCFALFSTAKWIYPMLEI